MASRHYNRQRRAENTNRQHANIRNDAQCAMKSLLWNTHTQKNLHVVVGLAMSPLPVFWRTLFLLVYWPSFFRDSPHCTALLIGDAQPS